MTKGTKAGQFSPVSLEALELIARDKKNPRLLLAYLGLARHTTMMDLDGRGPNMLTGAGAEKVRVLTSCGTPMARGMVNALAGMGLIKKPDAGLRSTQALWAMQHKGDINIPHALIDGGIGGADGIGRLLKEGEGFRVTAEPKTATASWAYINKIIGIMGGKENDENNSEVFWKAFNLLKNTGLFYEVVTAINIESKRLPIRINDFHATGSDPSLLDNAVGIAGVGYYTHKYNDRDEPEGCWFYLPSKPEKVIGIWRLRFRCATPETAKGINLDGAIVDRAITDMGVKGVLYLE